jgi:hypothetical protein
MNSLLKLLRNWWQEAEQAKPTTKGDSDEEFGSASTKKRRKHSSQ